MTRTCEIAVGLAFLGLLAHPSIVAAQQTSPQPQTGASVLKITGDVATPLTLSAEALKAMPRTKVDQMEDGRTVVYEGVLVSEILKRAGVPQGADLRGNALASYVLASATDGYQVVYALAELDPGFTGHNVIVADTIDGKPLFGFQGPFRLVSPGDSRPARSVRMLESFAVVRLRK